MLRVDRIFDVIYQAAEVFSKLVWGNLLWVTTSGLLLLLFFMSHWPLILLIIFFTLPPATLAIFHVIKVWFDKKSIHIWREYWRGWMLHWKRSYKVIYSLLIIGMFLLLNILLIFQVEILIIKYIGLFILAISLLLYLIICTTYIPLSVKVNLKLGNLYSKAFILSISRFFNSLATLILILFLLFITITKLPILALFLNMSLITGISTWQTNKQIKYIEKLTNK